MRTIKNLKFRDKKFYRYKYSNMSFDSVKGSYHSGIDTVPCLRSFFLDMNVRQAVMLVHSKSSLM